MDPFHRSRRREHDGVVNDYSEAGVIVKFRVDDDAVLFIDFLAI